MPNQMNIEEQVRKARLLLEHDTRVVTDRQIIGQMITDNDELERYNIDTIQRENSMIGNLLDQAGVEDHLSTREQARFRNIQNRNSSYLLLNDKKFGGDSDLMGNVKGRITALEDSLRTMPGSSESFATLEKQFTDAIEACRKYVEKKNPRFSTGKARKRMVEQQLEKLLEDWRFYQIGKEKLKNGHEELGRCMDILILGREASVEDGTDFSGELDEQVKAVESKIAYIRNVAVFRMKREREARDLLANLSADDEKLQRILHSIKQEVGKLYGANNDVGGFEEVLSEKDKTQIRSRISQLKKELAAVLPGVTAHLDKLETSAGFKECVSQNEDPAVIQAEQQAFDRAVTEIMEQDKLSFDEAKARFIEERMITKRPYSLTNLKETRKSQMKTINEAQLGTKVRISRDGKKTTGASDYRKKLKNWWEQDRFAENKAKGMSAQEAKKNIPDLPMSFEEAEKKAMDYLNQVLKENNSYQIRVPNCDIMKKIMENKRFKTQIETKSSYGGLNVLDERKKFTAKKFGTSKNLLKNEEYEVYGYLSHGDLKKECNLNTKRFKDNTVGYGVTQYGQMVVKLKKNNMRYRTTMLVGDSLSNESSGMPILMEDKKDIASVGGISGINGISSLMYEIMNDAWKEKNGEPVDPPSLNDFLNKVGQSYLELQFHGGVSIEDIESITLIGDYKAEKGKPEPDTELDPELVKMCKENGIKTFFLKDGDLNEV